MKTEDILGIVNDMYATGFDEINTPEDFLETLQELMRNVAHVDANATVSDVLKALHSLDD